MESSPRDTKVAWQPPCWKKCRFRFLLENDRNCMDNCVWYRFWASPDALREDSDSTFQLCWDHPPPPCRSLATEPGHWAGETASKIPAPGTDAWILLSFDLLNGKLAGSRQIRQFWHQLGSFSATDLARAFAFCGVACLASICWNLFSRGFWYMYTLIWLCHYITQDSLVFLGMTDKSWIYLKQRMYGHRTDIQNR